MILTCLSHLLDSFPDIVRVAIRRLKPANLYLATVQKMGATSVGPQKLPQSVFEAIMEECNVHDDDEIILGTRDRTPGGKPITTTAGDVKEKYADLYEQWQSVNGKGMTFKSVMAEIGYLGDLADHLSKKGDTNIIIFGHSHDSELDKDSWFVKDRIYANCGTWCDERKPCTFVETEKDELARTHYVRLLTWQSGSPIVVKEESVDL